MRFVGDYRVFTLFQADAVFDSFQHERESLDGDDNNRLRVFQRVGELFRFGTVALFVIDAPDHAVGVLELPDGVLKLVVQHRAVRHHDNGVELFFPVHVVQMRKLVGGPGNRVRLSGTGAVLDQVFMAGSFNRRGLQQFIDHIPLMITRENQALFLRFHPVPLLFFFNLQMDKTGEDF
ncbi:hypothetical protein HmCmsJML037_01719 [Escherichia coli]|nr:hypothetical protein HmCmsJML037_01719 [Escherichia coli]